MSSAAATLLFFHASAHGAPRETETGASVAHRRRAVKGGVDGNSRAQEFATIMRFRRAPAQTPTPRFPSPSPMEKHRWAARSRTVLSPRGRAGRFHSREQIPLPGSSGFSQARPAHSEARQSFLEDRSPGNSAPRAATAL